MSRPRLQRYLVPIKSAEQAAAQMLLAIRENLVRRRTQLANAIRGHAAEFGLVVPKGLDKIEPLLALIADDAAVPTLAKEMFALLGREFVDLRVRTAEVDKKLRAFHAGNELTRRLATIPGVGPIGACLLATKITNPHGFHSGRMCAAWIGLTPKDHSTAGKQKLGGITRAGDESLRSVLVTGATAYIQQVKRGRTVPSPWLASLLARKEPKPAAIALANKIARIAWKLMTSGQAYDQGHAAASAMAAA
jgi:transposase